jgi:hypothetical protein
MIKIVSSFDWSLADTPVELIKYSSRGLIGRDFVKIASRTNAEVAEFLRKNRPMEKGAVYIHAIALGASETYGPNRNGDGFSRYWCQKNHHTFVKLARFYRSHKNKDPSKSYGIIKKSFFNPEMDRIELIVCLFGNEKIASKYGGLVADKELDLLESGKDIPVSMACYVQYDVCSSCHNRARNRREYCLGVDEGGHCKHGGLRHNMGKPCEDGHILHADNPNPQWFDLSHVLKPADRTAYAFLIESSDK